MTGPIFARITQSFLDALNNGAVPTITSSWQSVEEAEYEATSHGPEKWQKLTSFLRQRSTSRSCQEANRPYGEREALLAEVVALHNQLLETLEIEESYIDTKFTTPRENEDHKSTKEVEEYKCANSSLIRKVDEPKSELSKYMSYSQTAVCPVETVLGSTDLNNAIGACNKVEGGSLLENNGLERSNVLHSSVIEELMDARTLLDTMQSRQDRLVEDLEYVRQENDRLVETLTNINNSHLHPMLNHESHISENGSSQNPRSFIFISCF